jgi:hypothetical protein
LVIVTETLGTAAPDGSVTVPNKVASWANARNEPANNSKERIETRRRVWLLKTNPILLVFDGFTANLQRNLKLSSETGREHKLGEPKSSPAAAVRLGWCKRLNVFVVI